MFKIIQLKVHGFENRISRLITNKMKPHIISSQAICANTTDTMKNYHQLAAHVLQRQILCL